MDKFHEARAFVTHLESQRTPRQNELLELAKWIVPYRGVFTGEDLVSNGTRRNPDAFLQAPLHAIQRAAAGITSGMTPRNATWFDLDFKDPNMSEVSGARAWLDDTTRIMQNVLANGGFYQAIHTFNIDITGFGCGALFTEKDAQYGMRFESLQVGTFAVAVNEHGQLDALTRSMVWNPARLAAMFGLDKLTSATRSSLETDPYKRIRVWHLVRRRDIRNPGKIDKQNMPWESLFWEDGATDFLGVGGYYEMPYFFTVWHESTNPYGTGPGDDALADVKQMDLLEQHKLKGMALLVDPPTQAPIEMKDNIDLSPGAINFLLGKDKITSIIDLSSFSTSIQYLQNEIQILANRIDDALLATVFASVSFDQRPKDMSATEFLERKREALQQLDPVMSAYEPNVLKPLLERLIRTLDRAGVLPIPPIELMGMDLMPKIDFVSPVANALRQSSVEATRAIIQDALAVAQAQPEVLDKVDLDQALDELATGLGAPGRVIRADSDVAQIRQNRAQQQAQAEHQALQQEQIQNLMSNAGQLAGAAKTLNEVNQNA